MNEFLTTLFSFALLVFGVFSFLRLKFCLPRTIFHLIKNFVKSGKKSHKDEITPLAGLLTALAGTIGTGNIVGVTGAIVIGGSGAVFWMWVSAILSFATKYAEVYLSVKYKRNDSSEVCGPMLYIEKGLGKSYRPVSKLFCILCIISCFGIGNSVQSNSIAESIINYIQPEGSVMPIKMLIGILVALICGYAISGGARRVTKVTTVLVPLMSVLYIGISILAIKKSEINLLETAGCIISDAFTPRPILGGIAGITLKRTISLGISRGVLSHEAGVGTAGMAHAQSTKTSPKIQATLGIAEVAIDTLVICTITAFTVLTSPLFRNGNSIDVMELLRSSFSQTFLGNYSGLFLSISITLFALSSMVCWALYGSICVKYLSGGNKNALSVFKLCYCIFSVVGACVPLALVWEVAAIINVLMAIPNLFALYKLMGEVEV